MEGVHLLRNDCAVSTRSDDEMRGSKETGICFTLAMVWEGNSCVAQQCHDNDTDTTYIDTPHSFGLRMGMGMKMKMKMMRDERRMMVCLFHELSFNKLRGVGSCTECRIQRRLLISSTIVLITTTN